MATDHVYVIDDAAVVSDIIGGEAVMLHRGSGDYFSADGIGCLIWQWIGEGHSRRTILKAVGDRCATEAAQIEPAVDAFLSDLVAHQLVRESDKDIDSRSDALSASQLLPKAEFVPPVLHVYSDIRSLVLLDPIHEVAQTGWPVPA